MTSYGTGTMNKNPLSHMRNRSTRGLFSYWNGLRRGRPVPWRSEIEPSDIHNLLPDVFIAELVGNEDYRFRLAGTRICAMFRKELKGRDLFETWSEPDQEGFRTLLYNLAQDASVGLIHATGTSNRGRDLGFEIIVMPLRHHDGSVVRMIGAISPVDLPYWLGANPIVQQTAETVWMFSPDEVEVSQPMVATIGGDDIGMVDMPDVLEPRVSHAGQKPIARRGHLTVYEGGNRG